MRNSLTPPCVYERRIVVRSQVLKNLKSPWILTHCRPFTPYPRLKCTELMVAVQVEVCMVSEFPVIHRYLWVALRYSRSYNYRLFPFQCPPHSQTLNNYPIAIHKVLTLSLVSLVSINVSSYHSVERAIQPTSFWDISITVGPHNLAAFVIPQISEYHVTHCSYMCVLGTYSPWMYVCMYTVCSMLHSAASVTCERYVLL